MMVGRDIADTYPARKNKLQPDDFILEVVNLQRKNHSNKLSFNLRRGEILGVAGLVGSGRTEMIRALIGADPVEYKKSIWREKESNSIRRRKLWRTGSV